jgi:hypothetical protein
MTVRTRSAPRGAVRLFDLESLERRLLFSTWINTSSRSAVANLYNTQYLASDHVDDGWNGNLATGDPGTTTAAFKTAVLNRINYFRSMAGVDNITALKDEYNAKAQQAALMSSANIGVSHNPPANWIFRTADAVEACASSNLALYDFGPGAIKLYMEDPLPFNYMAGHRRWVLFPKAHYMGTGDVTGDFPGPHPPANAMWWYDENADVVRPATRDPYVAWPAPGYLPYDLIVPRWSFAYDQADFSQATVTVSLNGAPVDVTLDPVENGYGENALVWEVPSIVLFEADDVYDVHVNNVLINNAPQNFSYSVTTIDPDVVIADPPPVLQSTAIGTAANTTQRSLVKQIAFTFDKPVTIAAGALSLMRLNTGGSGSNDGAPATDVGSVLNAPTSSNGGATWTYTFATGTAYTEGSGSLGDGIYTATLDASKVTAGGIAMAGANPSTTFHRLFGDVNGSKDVNNADFGLFRNTFSKGSADAGFNDAFDFDNSGTVNNADFGQFRNRYGKSFNY